MMSKSSIENVGGYDENVKTGEDWEMHSIITKFQFGVQSVLVDIRQHSGARLGDKVDAALETDMLVLNKHFEIMSGYLKAVYYQKIAFKMLRLGTKWDALKFISYSLKVKPWDARAYILLLSMFLPRSLLAAINNTVGICGKGSFFSTIHITIRF